MERPIRVLTDSVSDIPWSVARRLGIAVVPIYLLLEGNSYSADEKLDRDWFYSELERTSDVPQTAAPPPEVFRDVYRGLVKEGARDIVGLFLSSNLSSITNNATRAAEQLEGARVHIVETGQVSMGVGWLAIAAAEAAAQTTSIEEVCALVREMRSRTLVLGVLDSLKHLRYGGRVGWAAAQVVDFLQIKPIISFENSNAHFVGRVRTYRKALHQLIRRVQDEAPLERLAIIHSRVGREVLADLKEALQPYVTLYPIQIVEVGPIFGTHVGPRGIGVALVRAKER